MSTRLQCAGLTGGRGSLTTLRNIDLSVEEGAIHAVLGPNGAGKSTLLLTLAGLLPAQAGSIAIDGVPLRTGSGTAANRAGVVLVPDNRELFATLTVDENLRVASRRGDGEVEPLFELFPALRERRALRAGALSGGEQQMLAIARALVQQPKVLLVDELSMGLAPTLVERIFDAIRLVAMSTRCAIVVVEQYVNVALAVADSISVLSRGRIELSGSAAEIGAAPELLEAAYLGATDEAHT